MRAYKYHCGICGNKFSLDKNDPDLLHPACPVCGESRRLYLARRGFKRLLYGNEEALGGDFSAEERFLYLRESRARERRGCSRIPTCCGLAIPCDNPPCSECECELEYRVRLVGR